MTPQQLRPLVKIYAIYIISQMVEKLVMVPTIVKSRTHCMQMEVLKLTDPAEGATLPFIAKLPWEVDIADDQCGTAPAAITQQTQRNSSTKDSHI